MDKKINDWDYVANLLIDLELSLFEEVGISKRKTIVRKINKLEKIKQELLNTAVDAIPIKERTITALLEEEEVQGEDYEY